MKHESAPSWYMINCNKICPETGKILKIVPSDVH